MPGQREHPPFLGLLGVGSQFTRLRFWAGHLPLNMVGFLLGPIVPFARALIGQFAAGVVGDLGNGSAAFGATDGTNGHPGRPKIDFQKTCSIPYNKAASAFTPRRNSDGSTAANPICKPSRRFQRMAQ